MARFIFILICWALVSFRAAFAQDVPPENFTEVDAVLQKVLAARNSVLRGHFRLNIDRTITNVDSIKLLGAKQNVVIDIVFDGEKQKVEDRRPHQQVFMLVNGIGPNTLALFNPNPRALLDPPDRKMDPLVAVFDLDDDTKRQEIVAYSHVVFDPRRWGIITENSHAANDGSLSRYFTLKKKNVPFTYPRRCGLARETYQGDPCIRLTWEFGPKENEPTPEPPYNQVNVWNYWIIPGKSYIVRKAEMAGLDQDVKMMLENEVAEYKGSGLWFPVKWTYRVTYEDQLCDQEECRLEVLSMNEPINPKEFTLGSIKELKEGTPVIYRTKVLPEKAVRVWNGKEITSRGDYELYRSMKDSDSAAAVKRRWFIFSVNVVFITAIIAMIFYRRWQKQDAS